MFSVLGKNLWTQFASVGMGRHRGVWCFSTTLVGHEMEAGDWDHGKRPRQMFSSFFTFRVFEVYGCPFGLQCSPEKSDDPSPLALVLASLAKSFTSFHSSRMTRKSVCSCSDGSVPITHTSETISTSMLGAKRADGGMVATFGFLWFTVAARSRK